MKKCMTVFIALAVLALGGAAWALDKNTLTVRAIVTRACIFSSATSTPYWCTKDVTTGPVTATGGKNWNGTSRRMAGPGGDLLPAGAALGADYIGVTAGSAQDSVTLTILP